VPNGSRTSMNQPASLSLSIRALKKILRDVILTIEMNSPVQRKDSRSWRVALIPAVAAPLLFFACSRRTSENFVDIRGEPINQARPSTTPIQMAVAASPVSSNSVGQGNAQFLSIGFDKLSSYKFDPGEDLLNPQTNAVRSADDLIPQNVKAFDDKRVAVRGFMLPLKVEGGLVSEMLIMRDQSMCCYGVVPKINEWISVKMNGKGVKAIMDQAVTVYGTLHVGEMRENGYLVGIYRLDGQKMDAPEL
jgi:hypothetical protein